MLNSLMLGVGSVLPIKIVARYLLDRFVGRYIDDTNPIDLDQATMDSTSLTLKDLNLNPKVNLSCVILRVGPERSSER